jgi:hypothetical protein
MQRLYSLLSLQTFFTLVNLAPPFLFAPYPQKYMIQHKPRGW